MAGQHNSPKIQRRSAGRQRLAEPVGKGYGSFRRSAGLLKLRQRGGIGHLEVGRHRELAGNVDGLAEHSRRREGGRT